MENDRAEIHVDPLPFQQIPNWVFESGTSPTAIKLYLVLRKNGDNKRGTSYWSRKKLAEQMACSINTVDRAKAELITLGAICYIKRKTGTGDWTSNLYHIHLTSIHECKYLAPKLGVGSPMNGGTGSPKTVAQTNNHIELRTNQLNTRTYDAENHKACNLLADLIADNGSKRPTISDAWLRDMDKINRIDERSWEQIIRAIQWCQADEFWRGNILSPAKLRKQYDQLRLAAQRTEKKSKLSKSLNWIRNLENDTREIEQ